MALKKPLKKKAVARKVITSFRPMIRTRHPSHAHLRKQLQMLPFRSVIRLGSTWSGDGKQRVEINSVQSIKNSASKLLMKKCFTRAGVKTADWYCDPGVNLKDWARERYPLIAKPINGSRGNGIDLIKDEKELTKWLGSHTFNNYVVEKYYNFNREYRLHVTKDGCFYTCRKMLKSDVPEKNRFIRNDKTCVWILEENANFDKPSNWKDIEAECIKALKAVGLDIGGFDVRVQSSKTARGKGRANPDFIVIESNSACSHGDKTAVKYRAVLPKLILDKKNNVQ